MSTSKLKISIILSNISFKFLITIVGFLIINLVYANTTQNVSVIIGENILANKNSVLSSTVGRPQGVVQGPHTRKRKILDVEINKPKDIVMIRNGTDPVLLSFVFGENKGEVELNSESTAVSLVLLHPAFLGIRTDIQQALIPNIMSRSSFNELVAEIRFLIEHDNTPLDYWKHPKLVIKVNEVAEEILTTVDFKSILDSVNLRRKAQSGVKRGDIMIKEDEFKKGKLEITNPKAIYYSVYIDDNDKFEEENIDLLVAKEGLININFKLYPPDFEVTSSKDTPFDLKLLNSRGLSDYQIKLVQDITKWDPNTPEGRATWFNLIKGINLMIKTFGSIKTNQDKEKLSKWLKDNNKKIKQIRDFLTGKVSRTSLVLVHAGVALVGEIYRNCDDADKKKKLEDSYYLLKNALAFVDQLVELLKLDPIKPDEVKAEINILVKTVLELENLTDLTKKMKQEGSFFIKTEVIYQQIVLETQKKLSFSILSSEIPFNYDYAIKKLAGLFDALETNSILDALLNHLIAGGIKDGVKAITKIIFRNVFTAYYRVAATGVTIGNELVPFVYDTFTAPKEVVFSVQNGILKSIPRPYLEYVNITQYDKEIYNYPSLETSDDDLVFERGIQMSPGSCFTITYRAVMPYNFYRGVEAIEEGEINPSENEAVTHFLSAVSSAVDEVTFIEGIEGNVRHYLKIWDGKGWNKPAWKYVFSNENSSKEHHIGQSFDNWPSGDAISLESGHEIFNDFYNQDKPERDGMKVSDDICLSTENITEYLNISLSNFQEESIEFFPIKLRLPNREPEIEFFVDRDANNFLSYEFHTYVSDDYTLSKNIDVEVDFFEVIDEGEKKLVYQKLLNDGGKPQYFDYQFPSAGIYKLEIKAIDDEGFPNIQEIEVYPGSPFIDLKPSEWYTKSILLLHQNGILKGYEDGTFGVGNPVTRAEFLKIMLLTHDLITTNKIEEEKYKKYEETEFSDVKNDWKLGYIEHAREKGYVAGYPPKDDSDKRLFSPDNTIIRAEAAKIIANVFILDQKDISDEKDTSDKKKIICPQEYSDEKNSNAWYCEFLTALKETNIMTGYEDGSFGAAKEMTRAQAAVVACRAYAYKKYRNKNDFCDTRK